MSYFDISCKVAMDFGNDKKKDIEMKLGKDADLKTRIFN